MACLGQHRQIRGNTLRWGMLHRVNGIGIQARQMSSNVMVLEFANVFLVCMLSLDVIVSAHFLEKEN